MKPKKLCNKGCPRPGEVWKARNIKYIDKIGVKSRPIVVMSVDGDVVSYYKCTTSSGIPGTHHIVDPISAGLYKETYIIPKIEKIGLHRLAYQYGTLSRFDRDAIRNFRGSL